MHSNLLFVLGGLTNVQYLHFSLNYAFIHHSLSLTVENLPSFLLSVIRIIYTELETSFSIFLGFRVDLCRVQSIV